MWQSSWEAKNIVHKNSWCSWANPKNAPYKKYTEQITNENVDMVKADPDVKKLEDQLQGGQIEEVILQAENN